MWVGTDGAFFVSRARLCHRFDGRNGAPAMGSMRSGKIARPSSGRRQWAHRFQRRAVEYYRSPASRADNAIRTIVEAQDGAVWIGTIAGLRRLDRGIRGDPFASPKLIAAANIAVLWESRNGHMWIGTYGRGLMRFDNGRLVTMAAPASIPHNNVLAVFEDAEQKLGRPHGGMLRLQPGAANTITRTTACVELNTIIRISR